MVSTNPPVALVSLPPARFYFRGHIYTFLNEMWGNGKQLGGHVLDRAWRYGRVASRRLRPNVIPGSVLMVRVVLLGCRGLGTVHAPTIRPDDLTAAPTFEFLFLDLAPLRWGMYMELRNSPRENARSSSPSRTREKVGTSSYLRKENTAQGKCLGTGGQGRR
jgi:hypothetical protein